jgi:hypothetical protein
VLDGETCCVDEEGRPNFRDLLFRHRQAIFIAVDLLYLDGKDLRALPLIERKTKLTVPDLPVECLPTGCLMPQMNLKKVILGGLLAGLVINISETILNVPVMGDKMTEALKGRNLPPVGGGAIGGFVIGAFVVGILLVWLYAAIRPRFGAGAKTAVIAGLVLWLLAFAWPALGNGLMGMMPWKLLAVSTIWGLGEVLIAALAGGWVYTE